MRLNTILPTCLFCLASAALPAQSFSCGMDALWKSRLQNDPDLAKRHEVLEQQRAETLARGETTLVQTDGIAANYTLPLVVHIVHQNGAENIPDARVLQGIQHLNAAFANSGPYYDNGDGVPTPFQFCLALRQPNGAATNGINRVLSPLTDMTMETQDLDLKNLSRWDPTQYINIWVVAEINSAGIGPGVAGYAVLPSAHGLPFDGIVLEARWFDGTPASTAVLIHEMGHYLGLYHTFEGGCKNDDCTRDGDRVCDTPPDQATIWLPCNVDQNSCFTDVNSGFTTDQIDMSINYMDYNTFDCANAFTAGQSDRMEYFLLNARNSLLQSEGCREPCSLPVTAAFSGPPGATITAGVPVNFINASVNAVQYEWLIDGVPFSITPNATYQFPQSGIYVVQLHAIGTPVDCDDRLSMTITVTCPTVASFTASDPQPALGDTITLTSTSVNAATLEWMVNGVPQSLLPSWNLAFPNPGSYSVCLTTAGPYCQDVRCRFFDIADTVPCVGHFSKQIRAVTGNQFSLWEMDPLPGGGFIAGGYTGSRALLARFNSAGDLTGSWRLNNAATGESLAQITLSSDETIVCNGNAGPLNGPINFFYKFNYTTGQIVWANFVTFPDVNVYSKAVIEHPVSKNYWAWTTSDQIPPAFDKIFVTEFQRSNGNVLTRRRYNSSDIPVPYCNPLLVQGKFYAAGGIQIGATLYEPGLCRFDATGVVEWSKRYRFISVNNAPSYGAFTEMVQDGPSLVLVGSSIASNLTVIKTDLDGNVLWKRLYAPIEDYSSSTHTETRNINLLEDGYLISGVNKAPGDTRKIYLFKLNPNGDLIWAKSIDAQSTLVAADFVVQNGSVWVITQSSPNTSSLLVKIDLASGQPESCYPVADAQLSETLPVTVLVFDQAVSVLPPPTITAASQTINVSANIAVEETICEYEQCFEVCNNGLDDDGDGYVDCYDIVDCPCGVEIPNCVTPIPPKPRIAARLAWEGCTDKISDATTPIVANLDPGSGDSIPEIIVPNVTPAGTQAFGLLIFKGDGSNAASPDKLSTLGNFASYPPTTPTVGDVNGDGVPELILIGNDQKIKVFTNYVAGVNPPMTLLTTSAQPARSKVYRPYLADFNADGIAEIYAGNDVFSFNFNAPTGVTLTLAGGAGQAPYGEINNDIQYGSCSPVAADLLTLADCNGDPDCAGLEIAAGYAIFSVDLDPNDGDPVQVKIQRNLNVLAPGQNWMDGFTGVADIDLDGVLDVVVAGRRLQEFGVYVWNKTGLVHFFPYPVNTDKSLGQVTVANLYDDRKYGAARDLPELAACYENTIVCFNLNKANQTPAQPYWWTVNTEDKSGGNGMAAFDFNGDGWSELVHRGEKELRILYGGPAPFPSGVSGQRDWSRLSCGALTVDDSPVVADLDHDGQAEIATTGYKNASLPSAGICLKVFEADEPAVGPWQGARAVWNQFNYFVVHVDDDLSIPKQQQQTHLEMPGLGSGKRPLNQFLGQLPILDAQFDPFFPAPDATAEVLESVCASAQVVLTLRVCNPGSAVLPANTPLRVYRGDPRQTAAPKLTLNPVLPADLAVDSCFDFQLNIPVAAGPGQMLYVVVNDNGSLAPPFNLAADFPSTPVGECRYSNNIDSFNLPAPPPPLDLGPDAEVCQNGVWTFHAGPGFQSYAWSTFSSDSSITVYNPGVYWVAVTDQCGQVFRDTVAVAVSPATVIDLGADTVLCGSAGLQFQVPGFATYQWAPEAGLSCSTCPNPVAKPASVTTYTLVARTAPGCYSADSIRVTPVPTPHARLDTFLCAGNTLMWNGVPVPAGDSLDFLFPLAQGCDSVFTVRVAGLPTAQTQENRAICAGDSLLIFGQWRKTSGNYNQVFAAQNGCDSIHTVNLAVLPVFQTLENQTICSGDSVLIFGQWRKTSGDYNQVFAAQNGCDSTHTVNLAVLPVFQTLENQTICAGDSALIFGQWRKTAGNYQQVFAAQNGCDSTHTVNLAVLPVFQTLENQTICSGDSALIFGQWRKTSGNYNQVLAAQNGCDSAHTVNLMVLPAFQTAENRAICAGDSALIFGQWRKTSGNYNQVFAAQNGCDSVHTVNLTVLPIFQTAENRAICTGDSALIFGQWQNTAGSFSQTFSAAGGCDSTHTVNLTVLPALQTAENLAICTGDSVLVFGQWQNTAGSFSQTFSAAGGCDSTHTVKLTVLPVLQTAENRAICAGDSTLIFGQWEKTTGAFYQTFTASGGCDSTHTVKLTVLPPLAAAVEWVGPDCHGAANGYIELPATPDGLQFSLDGLKYQKQSRFDGLNAGAYQVFVRDSFGCVSVTPVQLANPDSLLLELPPDTTIVLGQWVQLTPHTNGTFPVFSWAPPDYLDCATCANPIAAPPVSTTYTLTIQDANGCTATGSTAIRINGPAVYIPNAFHPGSAGANSIFGVYAASGVRQVLFLEIFDRWGDLLFRREHLGVDGTDGWDGTYRGKACPPGVYVYALELEYEDGSRVKKAGEVTVVR